MPFFERSQGIPVTGCTLIENNYAQDGGKGSGIKVLLEASLRQAIHNSYARDPPKCHPGTREEYIRHITDWGAGGWEKLKPRALWMRGPAGGGKSAIAQTCAEKIEDSERLGATFFFYRPNGWNDPKKFVPTIAYQLTTRYPAYRDLVDAIILRDSLVLETSIDVQFRELLVKPLRELSTKDQDVGMDAVIIVDGLDECKTKDAQRAIIELVMTSIDQQTTPFLWAFFSRPEPHIAAAFSSELAEKVSWHLTLTISRGADSDIEAYLRDSFGIIRAKYGLPRVMAWPSEDDIRCLVDQSSGLFVYAATIVRYIRQDSSLRPEERLRSVLELSQRNARSDSKPLSKLDQFYTLIMEEIPKEVLPDTLSLLHIHTLPRFTFSGDELLYYCSALGLSLTAFHAAIGNLHSVLDIEKSEQGMPMKFLSYHASFTDFLSDSMRSGRFCIDTPDNHQRCLKAIVNTVHCTSTSITNILAWDGPDGVVELTHMVGLQHLFFLTTRHNVQLGEDILQQLSQCDWSKWKTGIHDFSTDVEEFIAKIPRSWRSKIIRPFSDRPFNMMRRTLSKMTPGKLQSGHEVNSYIIGTGRKKALLVPYKSGHYVLGPYPGGV